MRSDRDVIGFGHRRDLANLEDPAGMAEVRLDDVDRAGLKEGLEVPAAEQPFAERDRSAHQLRDLPQPFGILRQ